MSTPVTTSRQIGLASEARQVTIIDTNVIRGHNREHGLS